ncbi:MAG: isochorismatase family protein [Pontiella sp.]
MLNRKKAVLIVIDVQGKLHGMMHEKENLDANLERMIRCAKLLDVPLVGTEQIPEKLGATNEPFKSLLTDVPMIEKTTFSCYGNSGFVEAFKTTRRKQAILIGIEAHVCVYQTAMDLLEDGIEVFIIADAVSSRTSGNKQLAIQAMRDAGAEILPAETALLILLRDAADPHFKELLKLIK